MNNISHRYIVLIVFICSRETIFNIGYADITVDVDICVSIFVILSYKSY